MAVGGLASSPFGCNQSSTGELDVKLPDARLYKWSSLHPLSRQTPPPGISYWHTRFKGSRVWAKVDSFKSFKEGDEEGERREESRESRERWRGYELKTDS